MKELASILDLLPEELDEKIQPMFRARQICQWIYQKYADDFSKMSNLPKNLRGELVKDYYFEPSKCVKEERSKDGNIRYLFGLKGSLRVESVLLSMKEERSDREGKRLSHAKFTICVSSQAGCKSGCSFCLTTKGGLKRNLSAGKIVGQILWIGRQNHVPYERRVNIVYMGVGEPPDNLNDVVKAVRILGHNGTLVISVRRQTISTSGLAKQIKELGKVNLGVLPAISLHAVNDELRNKLMPINKAYNIASVIQATHELPIDMHKKAMFEHLLIDDINDKIERAKELVKLLDGMKAKVNLILFNPHQGDIYKRPSLEDTVKFQDLLNQKGATRTIRESKGFDISAVHGQLKEREKNL